MYFYIPVGLSILAGLDQASFQPVVRLRTARAPDRNQERMPRFRDPVIFSTNLSIRGGLHRSAAERGPGSRMAQCERINDQEMDSLRIHTARQARSSRAVLTKGRRSVVARTKRDRKDDAGSRDPARLNSTGHRRLRSAIIIHGKEVIPA